HVFRKHQKFLIATLCLMAIIAFVFLDLIGKAVGTAKVTNPVVVTTKKYGDLKRSDVDYLRERRRRLLVFLRGVAGTVSEGDRLANWTKESRQIGPLMLEDPSPEAAVNQWLLVQHAKELGMVVSDDTVTRYLRELADNRLNVKDFEKLYAHFHLNENVVYDTLHDAILAANVVGLLDVGLEGTTPGQRWDYYQRLYRKLDLEVAPVEVAQFVEQIDDPGDAELKAFFEEHKNQFPMAGSPEPGFKIPRRVSIEYVKAEFEQFADPEAISDEEIEAHYQENRDDYRRVRLPSLDLDEPQSPETGMTEPSETKPEGDPQETPPATQPSEPATGSAPEPTPEPAVEPTTEPAVEPTTEPAVEPSEAKPEPRPADEPKAETSRIGASSPFRFVSMAQEEADQPKAKADDDYKPLDEVKDEIRTLLARRKAAERMQTAMNAIQSAMKKHQKALIHYEASDDKKNQTPPELDLEPLAKAAKLKFVRTGLVTVAELEEMDIGLSGDGESESFARKVFGSMP
ncbi:MAG: hypothetical protein GX621_12960, partial [Pirellulaceae bacterium]|nr:hypothetical protein [Pirellulaceae bacterium]